MKMCRKGRKNKVNRPELTHCVLSHSPATVVTIHRQYNDEWTALQFPVRFANPHLFFVLFLSLPVFRIWKLTRAAVGSNVTVHLASGLSLASALSAGNQDGNLTWLILPLDCPRIAGPEYISTSWIAEMAVIHKGESRDLPTLLGSPQRTSLRLAAHELLIDGKHRPSLLPAADICVTKLFQQGRSHGKRGEVQFIGVMRVNANTSRPILLFIQMSTFPHEQIRRSYCRCDAGRTIQWRAVHLITNSSYAFQRCSVVRVAHITHHIS